MTCEESDILVDNNIQHITISYKVVMSCVMWCGDFEIIYIEQLQTFLARGV
jgi:hypothetical protein